MATPIARRAPAARWGLLVIALLLGVALISVTARSYLKARELAGTIARGQAERFLRGLRERAPGRSGRSPSREVLQALLDEHHEGGLRSVSVVDGGGAVVVAVGDPVGTSQPLPAPGELQAIGERLRLVAPPPPPPPHPDGPPRHGDDSREPPSPLWGPPPAGTPFPPPARAWMGGPPAVVLELVPVESQRLLAHARLDLTVGIVAALVLMLASAVFWRLSVRAERDAAQLADERHLAKLGEMSAVLAHEIKNPLTALKGHAQLLAEQLPDGQRPRRSADEVVEHAQRLEALIADLLAFARSGTISPSDVSPAELVEQVAREVAPGRVDFDLSAAPRRWQLDPARMRQVLVNLMDNAIAASPADARVEVGVRNDGDELTLTVRDRGEGIGEDERHAIFEPFHTRRTRGTGLGLAVARRIVELHGGRIEAGNVPDGGAIFVVTLPARVD